MFKSDGEITRAELAQCRAELQMVQKEREQLARTIKSLVESNDTLTRMLNAKEVTATRVSHLFGKPMDEICDIIDRDARTQNAIKGFVDVIDMFHKETKR